MGNKINENTAICNHTMRAGKHYVTFRIGGSRTSVQVGLIRPVKDFDKRKYKSFGLLSPGGWIPIGKERTERWGNGRVYVCLLRLKSGRCSFGGDGRFLTEGWNGQESFHIGDEIGMLLDLDAGTLSVYKNGRRLGVMKDSLRYELSGEFSWVASMKLPGTTVHIEKGPIPTVQPSQSSIEWQGQDSADTQGL